MNIIITRLIYKLSIKPFCFLSILLILSTTLFIQTSLRFEIGAANIKPKVSVNKYRKWEGISVYNNSPYLKQTFPENKYKYYFEH